MARALALGMLLCAAGLLVFARFAAGPDEAPTSVRSAPRAAASDAPAPPPQTGAPGDPDALAASFRQEVLRELEQSQRQEDRKVMAGMLLGSTDPDRFAQLDQVDWAYVEDVFAGRISGIPDERKAGISLQQMDRIGDIPYVQQLRAEKRFDELADLGFDGETVPWPLCMRTASCRLDRKSSPPL